MDNSKLVRVCHYSFIFVTVFKYAFIIFSVFIKLKSFFSIIPTSFLIWLFLLWLFTGLVIGEYKLQKEMANKWVFSHACTHTYTNKHTCRESNNYDGIVCKQNVLSCWFVDIIVYNNFIYALLLFSCNFYLFLLLLLLLLLLLWLFIDVPIALTAITAADVVIVIVIVGVAVVILGIVLKQKFKEKELNYSVSQ